MAASDDDAELDAAWSRALVQIDHRFEAFAKWSKDVVYVVDVKTRKLDYVSPSFECVWGEDRDVIMRDLGRWADLLHPEDRDREIEFQRSLYLNEPEPVTGEYRILRPDGQIRYIRDSAIPVLEGGRLIKIVGVARDITEDLRSRTALAQSETRLRAALESTTDSVFLLSRDWRFVYLNRRAVNQIAGGRDLVGENVWDAFPEAEGGPLWQAYHVCMAQRVPTEAEQFYEPLGRIYAARAFPAEGGGITVFFRDITEERERAARLADAERLLRTIGEVSPDLLFAKDRQGRMLYANPSALAVIGRPAGEVLGRNETQWHSDPDQARELMANDQRIMASGIAETIDEAFLDARTGQVRIFQGTKTPMRDAGTDEIVGLVGIARDVTDERSAAQQLAENEARLRLAIEAGQVGTFDWDLQTGQLRWDDRLRGFFGLPAGAPVSIETFFAKLHPDDAPLLRQVLGACLDPGSGGEYQAQYRVIAAGQERFLSARGKVQFRQNVPVRMIGTVVDLTIQHRAEQVLSRDKAELTRLVEERSRELQEAQARLAHAQRIEALGQLAGGMAHDFNNVLQAIQGGATAILTRPEDHTKVSQTARMLIDVIDRGATITRRLLAFSRRDELTAEPVEPRSLILGLKELLEHTIGSHIKVEAEVSDDLPALWADKRQVETVLVNLATNARDAMAQGGVLKLAATLTLLTEGQSAPNGEWSLPVVLGPGAYVQISVSDTGCGIAPDVIPKVMEPFFTTKREGEGTGLGLAMAKGFAEQSGGALGLQSVVGKGTQVVLWLPVVEGASGS